MHRAPGAVTRSEPREPSTWAFLEVSNAKGKCRRERAKDGSAQAEGEGTGFVPWTKGAL